MAQDVSISAPKGAVLDTSHTDVPPGEDPRHTLQIIFLSCLSIHQNEIDPVTLDGELWCKPVPCSH